jgi:hypothetical protein
VLKQIEAESARKWQRSWTETTKGSTTKEYFPDINERKKDETQPLRKFNYHTNGTREY